MKLIITVVIFLILGIGILLVLAKDPDVKKVDHTLNQEIYDQEIINQKIIKEDQKLPTFSIDRSNPEFVIFSYNK